MHELVSDSEGEQFSLADADLIHVQGAHFTVMSLTQHFLVCLSGFLLLIPIHCSFFG